MAGPADYIQQGFGQLGGLVESVGEKSRQPHPAIKRRIMDMLNRGMSPKEAATRAKLQMAGQLPDDDDAAPGVTAPPQPAALQAEPYGDGSPIAQRPAFQPMMSQPQTSRPLPTLEPAFTMRDAHDAQGLGLLTEPRAVTDTPEDRLERALVRRKTQLEISELERGSREKVATEKVGSTEKIEAAKIEERKRQYDETHDFEVKKLEQDWKKALLRARTSIENAREGRMSSKDVAALKAVLGYASSIEAQISSLAKTSNYLGGQMGMSGELSSRLEGLKAQLSAITPQVEDALGRAQQVMGAPETPATQSTSEQTKVTLPGNLTAHPRLKTRDGVWVKWDQTKNKYVVDPNQGE